MPTMVTLTIDVRTLAFILRIIVVASPSLAAYFLKLIGKPDISLIYQL